MNHPDEIVVIEVGIPGPAGDGFTNVEATQMRADMDTFLDTTIPQELDDLSDVNLGTPSNGNTLVYSSSFGVWTAATPQAAVIVEEGSGETTVNAQAERLLFRNGITASQSGVLARRVVIDLNYAGTGSAETVARSDHTHNPTIISDVQTFAATGNLSSGSRTLITYNAGPLLDGVVYDCKARVVCNMRNSTNAGEVLLGLRIGGSGSFPKTTTIVRTVGGVDRLAEWVFVRSGANGGAITGSGATVQVVADVTFYSGDATNIRHGWLEFEAHPRR